jgi:hypothetical protein
MSQDIAKQLETLPRLSATVLRALWHKHYGPLAPPPIRKGLLVRALAYRIQEKTHGALSRTTRHRLRKLVGETNDGITLTILDTPRIKLGTRLIRQWQGKTHEVTVVETGYTYRGRRYASLSEIARLITGSRWSGPLFFGLKASAKDTDAKRSHGR